MMRLLKRMLLALVAFYMTIVLLPERVLNVNAESKHIAVGVIYKIGDEVTVANDNTYILVDDNKDGTGTKRIDCFSTQRSFTVSKPEYKNGQWYFGGAYITGDPAQTPIGIKCINGEGTQSNPYTFGFLFESEPSPASEPSSEPAPAPKPEQDQTLITGYIVNGKDANGNDTYATFSQDNVWSVTKVTSNANSVTYDIKPQWETYGTVHVGISALGFSDGAVLVDHYKNGKLIATYNGWVTGEWCEFDNPDGFSTFVIRKPGTNAPTTTKRAYVPNTGVK